LGSEALVVTGNIGKRRSQGEVEGLGRFVGVKRARDNANSVEEQGSRKEELRIGTKTPGSDLHLWEAKKSLCKRRSHKPV